MNLLFYRPVSVTSVPGKIMEQLFLRALLRHMENKDEMTGGNQTKNPTLTAVCFFSLFDDLSGTHVGFSNSA